AVTRPEHEGRDVVAFEGQLDRVDGHLDVRRVLAGRAHALRDLDQLDLVAGQHPPVVGEAGPVGVGPAHDDPPALGEGVGDGSEVEDAATERLTGADREVLVVEEQRDALVVGRHGARDYARTIGTSSGQPGTFAPALAIRTGARLTGRGR